MASSNTVRRERRDKRSIRSDGKLYESRGDIEVSEEPVLRDLRGLRSVFHSVGPGKRRVVPVSRMVSSSILRSSLSSSKPLSKHRYKNAHAHRSETGISQLGRRKSTSRDDFSSFVYRDGTRRPRARLPTAKVSERRASRLDDDFSDSGEEFKSMSTVSEELESEPEPRPERKERKVKVIHIEDERPKSSRHGLHRLIGGNGKTTKDDARVSTKSLHRSNTTSSHKLRSQSAQDVQKSRPALERSHTISVSHLPTKSPYQSSLTSTKGTQKRSSFLGIFAPPIKEEKPPRLVKCSTCLSDDVRISKCAKLKCGHRMCHSCLKRIFKLSVSDPQHMPPKCCTSDHIPLKHVEHLFDIPFKKLWNGKFQEYTTRNRIYCPSRRCGEWIKPGNIRSEGGKKYGKCSRCKTKVCCLCNGKWHGNKDCPKDELTNAVLEAAKREGWQRCYNCRTMVELKEGCNHMTCHCRAEFCMICGLKWKTCNCPWFNYDQIEDDRLNNMREINIERDRANEIRIPERGGIFERPRRPPRAYHEELDARRRQELLDEEFARRLQMLGIDDDDDDYIGGIEIIEGVGNAQAHFMNHDFRHLASNHRPRNNITRINRERGIPVQPLVIPEPQLRRRARQGKTAPPRRSAERPMLRRARIDYINDAARHAPVAVVTAHRRARPPRPAPAPAAEPRTSVLAGLRGAGSGNRRVSAWRAHVEPGITPAEGVLSM